MSRLNTHRNTTIELNTIIELIANSSLNPVKSKQLIKMFTNHIDQRKALANTLNTLAPGISNYDQHQ